MTTNELIGYHANHSIFPLDTLEAAIPAAIDALYAARDAGAPMHDAAAEVALAVLRATALDEQREAPEGGTQGP